MKHQPQNGHLAGAEPIVKPTPYSSRFFYFNRSYGIKMKTISTSRAEKLAGFPQPDARAKALLRRDRRGSQQLEALL